VTRRPDMAYCHATLRHFGRPVRETGAMHRVSDRAEGRARARGERR
jgi:hypothetical protein